MSRWIEKEGDDYKVTIADMDECKHMYDGMCCNDKSDCCCYYVYEDDCKSCKLFEKEDGVIE